MGSPLSIQFDDNIVVDAQSAEENISQAPFMNDLMRFVGRSNENKDCGSWDREVKSLPKVAQLVSGGAEISTQVSWPPDYSASPSIDSRALYTADLALHPLNERYSY